MAEEYCQYKNLKAKLRLLDALLSKQQDSTKTSWVSHSGTFIQHDRTASFLRKLGLEGEVLFHAMLIKSMHFTRRKNRRKMATIWMKCLKTAKIFFFFLKVPKKCISCHSLEIWCSKCVFCSTNVCRGWCSVTTCWLHLHFCVIWHFVPHYFLAKILCFVWTTVQS